MSNQGGPRQGTGALIVTLLSLTGSIASMLGLIFAIPYFVNSQGARKELIYLLIWGAATISCFIVFCLGLMYLLRARRGIPSGHGHSRFKC